MRRGAACPERLTVQLKRTDQQHQKESANAEFYKTAIRQLHDQQIRRWLVDFHSNMISEKQ
jgi:hypothetical protein